MTNLPWMQIYIGDELAEAQALSAEEYGAHMLLRLHQWKHGELPTDEDRLMRISRIDRDRWPSVREILAPLFDWQWHHSRTAATRVEAEVTHKKRSEAGTKGVAARRERKPGIEPGNKPGLSISQSPSQSPSQSDSEARSPAQAPEEKMALDKGSKDTDTRAFPKPKTLEDGKLFLKSRGCPSDEMEKCLRMLMSENLSEYDIEPWDIKARARA